MIVVRAAAQADDQVLGLLDQQTWAPAVSPVPAPPAGTPFFNDRTRSADVLVADVDGETAGYVALRLPSRMPSHAHVLELSLAVSPLHQRRGVGEQLLLAAVQQAGRRQARKLTLRVLAPNTVARRLYQRCGFTVEGVLRQEFHLQDRYVDHVLMARQLIDGSR